MSAAQQGTKWGWLIEELGRNPADLPHSRGPSVPGVGSQAPRARPSALDRALGGAGAEVTWGQACRKARETLHLGLDGDWTLAESPSKILNFFEPQFYHL